VQGTAWCMNRQTREGNVNHQDTKNTKGTKGIQ
jgi:hypothetical protein